EVFAGELIGREGFTRAVAIKRVLPVLSADPSFAEMFRSEARIASGLVHPNIVSVLDFDRDEEGRLFFVMELIGGTDLRALVESGPLAPEIAAFVVAEVLRALAFAHGVGQAGVVHRDVTPHNVLISWTGAVKLGDFGIAKAAASRSGSGEVTQSGVVKGKPG